MPHQLFVKNVSIAVMFATTAMGCGGASEQPSEQVTLVLDISSGRSSATFAAASASVDVELHVPEGLVELTVDCAPKEADIDVVGFQLASSGTAAAAFGLSSEPPRAGYLRTRAHVPAGVLVLHLDARGGPSTCTVTLALVKGCGARTIFRSVNVDHTHVPPGPEPRADWEAFPVSGNHYPVWAAWNTSYPAPVKTGYLIHDLEHGGIVLSYPCTTPADDATCTTRANDLQAARTRFGQPRVNVTPAMTQKAAYAARAWRWGYEAACYDADDVQAFMTSRFRHGREDVGEDPFPAFDPTK